ncbi:MAG: hypothetical protein WCL02_01395 [bacterium]
MENQAHILGDALRNGFTITMIVGLIIVFIICLLLPKKKLCQQCRNKQTKHRNGDGVPVCEDCHNRQLLQTAQHESPVLDCPVHHNTMMPSIILDVHNVTVYQCMHPECNYIVLDKNDLQKITLLTLDLYPTKDVKK